jgi:hypothetical protein
MMTDALLLDHAQTLEVLVQSLAIGKIIDAEEVIIRCANTLRAETFGNWMQKQMALIFLAVAARAVCSSSGCSGFMT